MTIHNSWSRTAAAVFAAATVALFSGVPTANAVSAGPAPTSRTAPAQACPDIDVLARSLRTAGFSAQAVKNYTEFTRRDCNDGIRQGTRAEHRSSR